MNNQLKPNLKDPNVVFLSFLGVGFSPFAPGTMGTLVTLPFLYALSKLNLDLSILIIVTTLFTIACCFLAELAQKKYSVHDPGWIVIDETAGMTVAWLFIREDSLLHLLVLFALFRVFDIKKIWPASFFDNLNTGYGTILDDIIAGLYAGLIYLLGYFFYLNYFHP